MNMDLKVLVFQTARQVCNPPGLGSFQTHPNPFQLSSWLWQDKDPAALSGVCLRSSLLQQQTLTSLETSQGSLWITPAETHCNSQESSWGSERTWSLQRGNSKGGQIFPASWGKEKGSSHRASPRQCSPPSGSGQGGWLLQEPKEPTGQISNLQV